MGRPCNLFPRKFTPGRDTQVGAQESDSGCFTTDVRGPPLSEEDVRSFEGKSDLTLPASYKEFLLATQDGRSERDLFAINGLEGNSFGRIHTFFGLKAPVMSTLSQELLGCHRCHEGVGQ